ncbi:MAG: prolyl oligopeptidase family serine peptidase [Flavobacteriaceae bacterium]|nr:prolyl oligopeptidase family serine peptidase [Flavobacteriaceae bacterium]MDH3795325.1 prolyl oligopeptidase family serine peptidase [Flavobacteriaceae bacterium]
MKKFTILISFIFIICCFSCQENLEESYTRKWGKFQTQLIENIKSFQKYEEFDEQRGDFKLVTFHSDSLKLKGLLNTKNIDSVTKKPVVVYLHGGFALSYNELEKTNPFTDAGFITFAPSYRGENGNPGYFELFMGEVQDAKAAINWISQQPYIDTNNIYVFGWSVGGGISLNLSLHDDIPVKISGSSAGIYDYDLIKAWATEDEMIIFPYDYKNNLENYFRLPIYNLKNMIRPHYTYIGEEDDYTFYKNLTDSLYPDSYYHLMLTKLKGNHVSSLEAAMDQFIRVINK